MRRLFPRFRLSTHPLFHLALLAATLVTTTFFGAIVFGDEAPAAALAGFAFWARGLSFSLPLLLILGVHELGHVVACKRYGLPATLPYFIPAPFGIGTFGAVIRIRAPITEKKALFDVGAAGPLAGFLTTIPILIWGIAHSQIATGKPAGEYLEFGEPLLFRAVERWLFPATAHGADIALSPTGFAAWFGLLVTALNLLPLAQLDGGHILYSVLGRRHRPVAFFLFAVLLSLSFFWFVWLLWAVFVLVLGISHPPTAEESAPLDRKRKLLAFVCLIVFALCFTLVPERVSKGPAPGARPAPEKPARTYDL